MSITVRHEIILPPPEKMIGYLFLFVLATVVVTVAIRLLRPDK